MTAERLAVARGVVRYVWEHPSNAGHRPRALLRMAGYQLRARLLRRRAIARLGKRSRLWVDLHRTSAAKVMYANPPDMPEMQVWRQALRDGGLFLDVGANVGTYTIWAAECGAEVIALEPAADTFGLLLENIALNDYQVRAIQAAAGPYCGTARLTAGLDSVNRLDPDGPVETGLVTIDSLIGDRHVVGMKVDVEGFEIDVLRGCTRALSEHRIGLIQLEWNQTSQLVLGTDRRPVADLLQQHGYQLFRPDPQGRLVPVTDNRFGTDVFARPVAQESPMTKGVRGSDRRSDRGRILSQFLVSEGTNRVSSIEEAGTCVVSPGTLACRAWQTSALMYWTHSAIADLTRNGPNATLPRAQSRILRSRGLRSLIYPWQANSQ